MNLRIFRNYGLWASVVSLAILAVQGAGLAVLPESWAPVITTALSVIVLLGIASDPYTENRGFGNDMKLCPGCGERTKHVSVNGESLCSECGNPEVKIMK